MVKTIIFDVDGTLANTFPIVVSSVNALSEKYKYEKIKEPEKFRDKDLHIIIKEHFGMSLWKLPFFYFKIRPMIINGMKNAELFKGIPELILELKKKYEVGILTSNKKKIVSEILTRGNIDSVNFIYDKASLFGKHKTILKMLEQHNLRPEDVIYVGDEVRDVEACKFAGVRIISVAWGFNTEHILREHNPDFVAEQPKNILEILEKIK